MSVDSFDTALIDFEDHPDGALPNGAFRECLKRRGALIATIYSAYSAVYASSRVATGEYAAVVGNCQYVWDTAAIEVITSEAGGRVTDLAGEPLSYSEARLRGFIVSNGGLHDALLDEISRLTAEQGA